MNICSLKNKILNLEKLANDRKNSNKDLNFICLTEHWLKAHEMEGTILNNYEILSNSCRQSFKNGGTLIASSENNCFHIKVRKDLQHENTEKIFESSVVEFKLNKKNCDCVSL